MYGWERAASELKLREKPALISLMRFFLSCDASKIAVDFRRTRQGSHIRRLQSCFFYPHPERLFATMGMPKKW